MAYSCVCDQRKPHLWQLQHDLVLCQAWPLLTPAVVMLLELVTLRLLRIEACTGVKGHKLCVGVPEQ